MKKIFFCVSLALAGLMTSCVEKYEEVDAESKPSWLGSSIYAELQEPRAEVGLQGTFTTYLRLIDELGEAETLNRTGSKTVFPANDEAFARFFQNNNWGVSSYEDLSLGQKKLLLYSSMLDNPLLLQLLPNVSNGSAEPQLGGALKHQTNVGPTDSITHLAGKADMPVNNPYWADFYATGIDLVTDATSPMMVHLTREYMLNNDITTSGPESDFAIITGTQYPDGEQTAFVFNDQVMVADVTCQNGYIHQMQDVVVPPGNMPQVLRQKENTKLISRVLDYFAVPVEVPTTTNYYNAWARNQSPALPDKTIYAMRYLSSRSYDSETGIIGAMNRVNGRTISNLLNFDPGWNQYYQKPTHENSGIDYPIMDMGAFFAPTDEAMANYFVQRSPTDKGAGAYLMDIYGNYKGEQNTPEHLAENLDSLHSKNPQVLTAFLNNLLKTSFAASVPSKFESVPNDAGEFMGLTKDLLVKKADGKYDISVANNGAVYVLNELLPPDEYQAVLAPASVYPDMRVMNWAVQDKTPASGNLNKWSLGVDFKYYLLSMSSNYAFFIPEDDAFARECYYLDPTSLKHKASSSASAADRPEVLHFYYNDEDKNSLPYLKVDRHYFDLATGTVDPVHHEEEITNVRTQLIDILNYHTIVLPADKVTGTDGKLSFAPIGSNGNRYFKTKHGGEIVINGSQVGNEVKSGLSITYPDIFPAPKIKQVYEEKNGHAYRLDNIIQPPVESVYSVLSSNSQFSKFLELCNGFRNQVVMSWAGVSTKEPTAVKDGKEVSIGASQYELYQIFVNNYRLGGGSTPNACLDYNVRMFNTYNYTLFAPDNDAMDKAYNEKGLPSWSDIIALHDKWKGVETDISDAQKADMAEALRMIDVISEFVRYHFVVSSVYADEASEAGRYKTFVNDDMGVAKEVYLTVGGGQLMVRDAYGTTQTINGNDSQKVVNRMTRDYWLGMDDPAKNDRTIIACANTKSNHILTSSFCAVHQISEPLVGMSKSEFDSKGGKFFSHRKQVKSRR